MTYCVAITIDQGLVFCSDSRTNAGADQVSTYGKMHTFGRDGERQIVLLSAGNLATTQAVLARLRRDITEQAPASLMTAPDMEDAAEYLGQVLRRQDDKHGAAVARAGFSAEASFIIGGQIGSNPARLFLVYPQGNFITTSEQTPFLQIGETKYGRPLLDRIIRPTTSLDDAARAALVSMDSTIRSNVTVGPPVELLSYVCDSLILDSYLCLREDDDYLLEIKRAWNEKITQAFNELPAITWTATPNHPRFLSSSSD